ncbi:sperm flagellar protein 1-like [Mauremys mutica]|nr:sperm flagellar protein 1-like [Mauremys mutica]
MMQERTFQQLRTAQLRIICKGGFKSPLCPPILEPSGQILDIRDSSVNVCQLPTIPKERGCTGVTTVLAAEVVKFYFPKMVEMHNYVPANSTQQKLSNWGHLNRKVLNKLNFSIPEDMIRKIVQCTPGVVELMLLPLRQKIEEKQKQSKVASGTYQELGTRYALHENGHMETGYSSKPKTNAAGLYVQQSPRAERMNKGQQGYAQALPGDASFRIQLAEREQALLACQETVQILQMKVRRLEHLLHLKNVRIDDLTRRLQQVEQKQK